MDLEKIKKSYKWDPTKGDYPKDSVSFERRLQKRKRLRNNLLIILYILILIASVIFVYQRLE